MNISEDIISPDSPIDPRCLGLKFYEIKDREICQKHNKGQLLGKTPFAVSNYFSVRVIKTKKGIISFGAIDSKQRKD